MTRLVDRHDEVRELSALADAGRPKLALLYGRRRVGKTFLLTNIWPADRALYFTASATTPEQNRRHLVEEAGRWAGTEFHAEDYPTWRTVFRMLLSLKPDRPIVVVLDEFQYLAEGEAGLREVASEFNAVWEAADNRRPILVVVSGSSVRTVSALAQGGSPLYGRFDWQARLEPFDYWNAARMVPGYDHADHLRVYGAFGGVPRYLAPVNPDRSVELNIQRLLLDPRGEVRLQLETAIHQEEGLQEVWKYQAILTAIGTGQTKLGDIANKTGLTLDKAFRQRLDRLIDLGYVRKAQNLGAGRTSPYLYRIADPAMASYYALVAPYETALEVTSPKELWKARLKQLFDTHMERASEGCSRAHSRVSISRTERTGTTRRKHQRAMAAGLATPYSWKMRVISGDGSVRATSQRAVQSAVAWWWSTPSRWGSTPARGGWPRPRRIPCSRSHRSNSGVESSPRARASCWSANSSPRFS
jgi:AAA+ ATPase superfamily predicted ATPase